MPNILLLRAFKFRVTKSLNILPNLGEEASLFSIPFYPLSPLKTEGFQLQKRKGFQLQKFPRGPQQPWSTTCGDIWGTKMLRWRRLKHKRNSYPDWVLTSLYYLRHLLASVCIVFYYQFYTESIGNPDWGTRSLRQLLLSSCECEMSISHTNTYLYATESTEKLWLHIRLPLESSSTYLFSKSTVKILQTKCGT